MAEAEALPRASTSSCGELAWAEPSGSVDHVCGAAGANCPRGSYADAEALCLGMGARLCTFDEIGSGEATGTGCGFDNERVWTSTADACAPPRHMSAGGLPEDWGEAVLEMAPDCEVAPGWRTSIRTENNIVMPGGALASAAVSL